MHIHIYNPNGAYLMIFSFLFKIPNCTYNAIVYIVPHVFENSFKMNTIVGSKHT